MSEWELDLRITVSLDEGAVEEYEAMPYKEQSRFDDKVRDWMLELAPSVEGDTTTIGDMEVQVDSVEVQ